MGSQSFGIKPAVVGSIARELATVHELGVQIAVVVGGGNIIRGVSAHEQGIDRITGDSMGMLATVMNSLARVPGVVCADIELGRLNSARRNFPSIEHRRLKCLNDA